MDDPIKKLWDYKHDDITTWKYIDCVINCGKESFVKKWILNPDFKYEHIEGYKIGRKPHKCPICEGSTFCKEGMDCKICEGSGIVWD